jgi:arylsulfatase A-like enzyme
MPKKMFVLVPCLVVFAVALPASGWQASSDNKPNIIFIMSDDQGYADLGCYGSKQIKTPHMDKLAAEGMRFTDVYSGSAVCGPTRCVLMTGMHPGHATRRDNTAKTSLKDFKGGRPLVPLKSTDFTVASALKKAGYATGGFGKWGIGNPGTTGIPEKHGFDDFYGYYDQVHAHSYYPTYLVRNSKEIPLPGNLKGKKKQYTHDVLADAALDFIREHKEKPFFLYLPYTPPHGKYEVPDDSPYSSKSWSQVDKNYAAMITRMDGDIGEMMALLKKLKLDENTIVFYTSDNGPNKQFLKTFASNKPFRGIKRQLTEGGLRCPMIVRWPNKVPAGKVSDYIWGQVDFFATACDLAGLPANTWSKTDSHSVLPTLLGKKQEARKPMYFEIHSPFQQAVRMGQWKGLRYGTQEKLLLYDVNKDPSESMNVAAQHDAVVKQIEAIMVKERKESKYWPAVAKRKVKKSKNAKNK